MVRHRCLKGLKAPRTLFAVLFFGLNVLAPATYAQQPDQVVERSFATALIRDILMAVNHGNWTGNYTVLRDYAASDFAAANDPTRLAGLFAPVREAGLDMLPVLVTEPEILETQVAAAGRQMRLTGYFPTLPQHISFDLVFLNEKARWVLLDISVGQFEPIVPEDRPAAVPETPAPASGN